MSTTGLAGFVLIVGSNVASAQCKLAISDYAADYFVAQPRRLLDDHPLGGPDLADAIRTFATFDRSTLMGVKAIIAVASPAQKQAIGDGLALAVTACLPRDGETAKQIADVVRFASDRAVMQGYMRSTSDDDTVVKTKPEDDHRPGDWVQDGVLKAPSLHDMTQRNPMEQGLR